MYKHNIHEHTRADGPYLLLLVKALLVAVGDVDAPWAQHVDELELVQGVLHLSTTRALWGSRQLSRWRAAPGTQQGAQSLLPGHWKG